MPPKSIFRGENGLPLEIDSSGAALRRARAGGPDLRGRRGGGRHRGRGPARPPHAVRRRHLHRGRDRSPSRTAARSPRPRSSSAACRSWTSRTASWTSCARPWTTSLARSAEEEIREIDLLQDHLHDDVAEFVYERLQAAPDDPAGRRRGLALPSDQRARGSGTSRRRSASPMQRRPRRVSALPLGAPRRRPATRPTPARRPAARSARRSTAPSPGSMVGTSVDAGRGAAPRSSGRAAGRARCRPGRTRRRPRVSVSGPWVTSVDRRGALGDASSARSSRADGARRPSRVSAQQWRSAPSRGWPP